MTTQTRAALRAIADALDSEGSDVLQPRLEWLMDAARTLDTLDDFVTASRSYREATVPVCGTLAGLPTIAFSNVQTFRGAQRRALSIIDLGDVRVVLDEDVREWMDQDGLVQGGYAVKVKRGLQIRNRHGRAGNEGYLSQEPK